MSANFDAGVGRKADLIRFGLLGAAIFALSFWVHIHWLEIAAWLMGRDRIVYAEQPGWIRGLYLVVEAVPWLIGVALLVFALQRRRWAPLLAFAGAQLLCLGAIIAVLFVSPTIEDYTSRIAFESAVWKAENRGRARGIRVKMVDDLLRKHKLVGMARAELENLLGVPPKTNYFRRYDYVYWLGQERGFMGIDSEWLAVKFTGDTVTQADVVRD